MNRAEIIFWNLRNRKLTIFLLLCSVLFIPIDFWFKQYRYVGGAFPIPQILRSAVLGLCLIYIFKKGPRLSRYEFDLGWVFSLFVALWLFHGVIGGMSVTYDLYFTLKSSFFIFVTIVFYRLYLSGSLTEKDLATTYIFVILFAGIYAIALMADPDVDAGQNAGSYIILWCIPLLLKDRRPISLCTVVLGFIAIFITVKRGPALALIAGVLCYFVVGLLIRQRMLSLKKLISVFFILTGLGGAFYWQYDNYVDRFKVFAEVDRSSQAEMDRLGSGRVLMARVHMNHYLKGDLFDQIFGYGNMQDYLYYGEYRGGKGVVAHSTWVAMVHNYGAVGILLLLVFFYKISRNLLLAIKYKLPIAQSLAMALVAFFLTSIYSSVLFAPDTIYFGFLMAVSMVQVKRKQWGSQVALQNPSRMSAPGTNNHYAVRQDFL